MEVQILLMENAHKRYEPNDDSCCFIIFYDIYDEFKIKYETVPVSTYSRLVVIAPS